MEQVVEQVVEKPARPALPLLALLLLASALGVAAAVVLAAVAMLLAAPAYAEDGRALEGAPESGLLLERSVGLKWADRRFTESESHDDGYTRVVEEYHNPFDEPLAGVYLYRLPPHAVVERLTFTLPMVGPRHAVLTRKETAALVERIEEIGPG